jgi:apolipoprotein D and lipocalin family protein
MKYISTNIYLVKYLWVYIKMSHNTSVFRFIHNVIGGPNVSVYLDNNPIASILSYKDITAYLPIKSGKHKITVEVAGAKTILISNYINIRDNKDYTYIIAGGIKDLSTIKLLGYCDDLRCPNPGYAHVRFIHAAFSVPAVDVYVGDAKVFSNVKYTDTGIPTYYPLKIDNYYYKVSVKVAGTNNTVVGPLELSFVSGGIYTIVASGNVELGLSALFSNDNPNKCEILEKNFDTKAYMGKWYQIASIPQFYDKGCVCQMAQYTLLQDKVDVFNTCYRNDGTTNTINGSAVASNPCIPAALTVSFPNFQASAPNYLVHSTDYVHYAIVGSPTRKSFYILSRLPDISHKRYMRFLEYGKSLGYDTSLVVKNNTGCIKAAKTH